MSATQDPTIMGKMMSQGLTSSLGQIRQALEKEDLDEEQKELVGEVDEVIAQTGDMYNLLAEMQTQGGPASLMGLIRHYMQKYKVGTKRLAVETSIKPERMKILVDDLDGPTPWEFEMMSKFFLPKELAYQTRQNNPPKMSFLEKKRIEKQRRLAAKENRKHPRPEVSDFV